MRNPCHVRQVSRYLRNLERVPDPLLSGSRKRGLNQQTCVELKVSEPCGSGENYDSLLNQCKSVGSQAARMVCGGDGKIFVVGNCVKPLITPTCSSGDITATFKTSVF